MYRTLQEHSSPLASLQIFPIASNSAAKSSIASNVSTKWVNPSVSPRLSTSDRAVRHAFLICRPVDVARRELQDEVLPKVRVGHAGLAEERAPDLRLRRRTELPEVQRDVDAREEGLVEGLDAVRREEEDAAVVLDVAQAEQR